MKNYFLFSFKEESVMKERCFSKWLFDSFYVFFFGVALSVFFDGSIVYAANGSVNGDVLAQQQISEVFFKGVQQQKMLWGCPGDALVQKVLEYCRKNKIDEDLWKCTKKCGGQYGVSCTSCHAKILRKVRCNNKPETFSSSFLWKELVIPMNHKLEEVKSGKGGFFESRTLQIWGADDPVFELFFSAAYYAVLYDFKPEEKLLWTAWFDDMLCESDVDWRELIWKEISRSDSYQLIIKPAFSQKGLMLTDYGMNRNKAHSIKKRVEKFVKYVSGDDSLSGDGVLRDKMPKGFPSTSLWSLLDYISFSLSQFEGKKYNFKDEKFELMDILKKTDPALPLVAHIVISVLFSQPGVLEKKWLNRVEDILDVILRFKKYHWREQLLVDWAAGTADASGDDYHQEFSDDDDEGCPESTTPEQAPGYEC